MNKIFNSIPVCEVLSPLCLIDEKSLLSFCKNEMLIYKCLHCGAGHAMQNDFAATYFDSSFFGGRFANGYSDYLQARLVLHSQFQQDVALLNKLEAHHDRLLELGSAYGFFLDKANDIYQVIGNQLCEEVVQNCKTRGNQDVQ